MTLKTVYKLQEQCMIYFNIFISVQFERQFLFILNMNDVQYQGHKRHFTLTSTCYTEPDRFLNFC